MSERMHDPGGRRVDQPAGPPRPIVMGDLRVTPPHWAGARSYDLAWEAIERLMNTYKAIAPKITPRIGIAGTHMGGLSKARPIVVAGQQVESLPDLSRDQAAELAPVLALPHEAVYLDFMDAQPGGHARLPAVRITENVEVMMVGALVHRPTEDDVLAVLPFGRTLVFKGGVKGGISDEDLRFLERSTGINEGHEVWFVSPGDDADIVNMAEPLGAWICSDWSDAREDEAGLIYTTVKGIEQVLWPLGEERDGKVSRVNAVAQLAANSTQYAHAKPEIMRDWARMIERMAAKALAVLYLLDSANVELVEAGMHRRDIKRAEKRGWPRAQAVRVRVPARRSRNGSTGDAEPSGMVRQAHLVRGFYRHVTSATHPHVRCDACEGAARMEQRDAQGKLLVKLRCKRCAATGLDPDKVKPCVRRDVTSDTLTCPDGCRREFVPEHVRGQGEVLTMKAIKVSAPRETA